MQRASRPIRGREALRLCKVPSEHSSAALTEPNHRNAVWIVVVVRRERRRRRRGEVGGAEKRPEVNDAGSEARLGHVAVVVDQGAEDQVGERPSVTAHGESDEQLPAVREQQLGELGVRVRQVRAVQLDGRAVDRRVQVLRPLEVLLALVLVLLVTGVATGVVRDVEGNVRKGSRCR